MKAEFIQEVIEGKDLSRLLHHLTGWESVVFEMEDEPTYHPEREGGEG